MLIWLWLFWQDPKPIEIRGKEGTWVLPNCQDRTIPAENAWRLMEDWTSVPGAVIRIQLIGFPGFKIWISDADGKVNQPLLPGQEIEEITASVAGMTPLTVDGKTLAALDYTLNLTAFPPTEVLRLNCANGPINWQVPVQVSCDQSLFSEAFDGHWQTVLDPVHRADAITKRNAKNETVLMFAAANGGPVLELLESGADPFAVNDYGLNSLYYAVFVQDLDALDTLLSFGLPVEGAEMAEETPLLFAAKFGLVKAVNHLLSKGANIGARDFLGQTALDYALERNYFELGWSLWKRGCPVTPHTFQLALRSSNVSWVKHLWQSGQHHHEFFSSCLEWINDHSMLRFALDANLDDWEESDFDSGLEMAIESGQTQLIPVWLDWAKSNQVALDLNKSLHTALASCQMESAKLLLAAGADPGADNKDGELPIEAAWDNSCTEVVAYWFKERLPFPEDFDREDIFEFPNEVLREAILEKQDWRVESALKSGAQLNQPDDDCLHPLDLAIVRRYPFGIRTIYEHGGTSLLRPNLSLPQLLNQFRPQAENEITLYDILP
ncbi:MAG: ankyrin repeat domain-containing protein [Acidobacteria bacterium]|nr:ankyrin repeat domain-containing protein [Acidobacteriota bacterium]MCB9398003.1 ankyrin repeat domain-containing protein [Acidobacteriota bacterium]